jgi:hypothetical protein
MTNNKIPEHEFPGFPVKVANESGWSYACRLSTWREQRARKELRERQEAERVVQIHPDTVRRTKAEQQLLRAREEKFNRDRTNVEFGKPRKEPK